MFAAFRWIVTPIVHITLQLAFVYSELHEIGHQVCYQLGHYRLLFYSWYTIIYWFDWLFLPITWYYHECFRNLLPQMFPIDIHHSHSGGILCSLYNTCYTTHRFPNYNHPLQVKCVLVPLRSRSVGPIRSSLDKYWKMIASFHTSIRKPSPVVPRTTLGIRSRGYYVTDVIIVIVIVVQ